MMRPWVYAAVAECVCIGWSGTAAAQDKLDQADPSITEASLPKPVPAVEIAPQVQITTVNAVTASEGPTAEPGRVATAIIVDGRGELNPGVFSETIVRYVGRGLSRDELSELAGTVAAVARARGYPLASASIPPQSLRDGVLRIALDEGKVDAVRVIGGVNRIADSILTVALVTGQPVRRAQLERAIALVEDIPGVSVRESRFVRQNGFGIVLVTIDTDRASGYVQVDNRGSKEIGPIRSTLIGNVRGVIQHGDELGIVASQTPLQSSEFAFVRARYSSPLDRHGSVLSVSGSYGRAHPGASLSSLDVIGRSVDLGIAYARPLVRSRSRSLWAAVEFRALKIDQSVLGTRIRDDRLATLTGSLNGMHAVAKGVFRGEIAIAAGLPLSGVTHRGDQLASRPDGDARFITASYALEWAKKLNRWLGVAIGSVGQLASRPLLATAEIGLGGPAFGRGYDSSERTGDQGLLGSLELRADTGRVIPGVIDRLQIYGFVDGGVVDNLRRGIGGGTLASAGAGMRLGRGGLDAMAELAVPLNADRFDTSDRRPRISLRLSRSF